MREEASGFHRTVAPGSMRKTRFVKFGAEEVLSPSPHLYTGNNNTYLPPSGGILKTKVLKHFVSGA